MGELAAVVEPIAEVLSALRAVPAWPSAPRPVPSMQLLAERVVLGEERARGQLRALVHDPLAAAGADLLEGKVTLPVIHLLAAEPRLKAGVQAVIREGAYGEFTRDALIRAAEKSGALERTRAAASSYTAAAAESLAEIAPSKFADGLRSIPTYILEREM